MLYFAYGSNMFTRRLRERVPSARPLGTGVLENRCLAWHKRGADGSGKCAIPPQIESSVYGVVFDLADADILVLDRIEGVGQGYIRSLVRVAVGGQAGEAFTYSATCIQEGLQPFHWYKHLVVAGAIEHGLPAAYIEQLASVRSVPDEDRVRSRKNEALLIGYSS